MTELFALLAFLLLYGIVRFLNLASPSLPPELYVRDRSSAFVRSILAACPIFLEPYIPPLLWGKNGHLQTIIYAKMGRVKLPVNKGQRHAKVMPDGATMTFDLYEPKADHSSQGDYTILVCPGIANSSESSYIRTLVNYAQIHGYRVAVLNHLGALQDVKLTAPRIFDYGSTAEFGAMVSEVQRLYSSSKLVALGFSMGANIVVKYLGESREHQDYFICGISVCQGYDANQAKSLLMDWENLRRAYIFLMTENQKLLLRRHYDILFGDEAKKRYGKLDEEKIFAATSLVELDENYSSRRAGFAGHREYYEWCSCRHHIHNIDIPLLLVNAKDDPLVPRPLLETAKSYAKSHEKCVFALTQHGGHLGYFERGLVAPHAVTWLDRAIIQFTDAIVIMKDETD